MHSRGRLTINPAYRLRASADGIDGVLAFPSDWYEFENGAMRDYHAPFFHMSAVEIEDMERGRHTARIQELVDSFVLIGAVSDIESTD